MDNVVKIILGTPWYAWLALAYVLHVGISAMRERVVPINKLFIMPIVLVALKYKVFFSLYYPIYILSFLGGIAIGFIIAERITIQVMKKERSIKLQGEYFTLPILIIFFAIKYLFGYLQATTPGLQVEYIMTELIITGVVSGAFLGRALRFIQKFKKQNKN